MEKELRELIAWKRNWKSHESHKGFTFAQGWDAAWRDIEAWLNERTANKTKIGGRSLRSSTQITMDMNEYENERLEGMKEYHRLENEQRRVDNAYLEIQKNLHRSSNPFYDNHLFSKTDLERITFSRWNWIWLWFYPTYTQVTDGYAFHYKVVNGAYWLIKHEEL